MDLGSKVWKESLLYRRHITVTHSLDKCRLVNPSSNRERNLTHIGPSTILLPADKGTTEPHREAAQPFLGSVPSLGPRPRSLEMAAWLVMGGHETLNKSWY